MKKRFIESTAFTEWVQGHAPAWDETYAALQQRLMEGPDLGRVIPGCGGLRKARIADPKRGKGKRGGARIIYLHVPEADWIYLLDIYDKDERADLSPDEKKILAELAEQLKAEARAAAGRAPKAEDQT
jgi:hypothetical protein